MEVAKLKTSCSIVVVLMGKLISFFLLLLLLLLLFGGAFPALHSPLGLIPDCMLLLTSILVLWVQLCMKLALG